MKSNKITFFDTLSESNLDQDAEFIPLMTAEDEEEMTKEETPNVLPILPLKNTVLFPGVVIPITVGRDKSIKLIKEANKAKRAIGILTQIKEDIEDPTPQDLYKVGVVARILRVLTMPDGNTTVIIQGKKKFEVKEFVSEEPYLQAQVTESNEIRPDNTNKEFVAIVDSIKDMAIDIIEESPNIPSEASFAIQNIESSSFLINFVSANMNLSVNEKQSLLEVNDLQERAMQTLKFLNVEFQKLALKNDIQSKVQSDINKQQREYYLHQQMKTIQEELGVFNSQQEFDQMLAKATKKKWSKKVEEHFKNEHLKFQRMNPQMPEYSIQRNYLELLLELPWEYTSKDRFDLKRAQRILDRDHYGLEDVKERILEYIAVLKLRKDLKAPILCLQGPPGVGKTSLGKSVAEALGREYVRVSLGGLRDEAEIRGHRKTYIGAMPGRIIQNIKKAKTSNPVFVLDEIDKLSYSNHGDPSSALLEVLDPEQNSEFYDNFLEIGYDLSKVLFIATSNNISNVQPALRDRMEVIEVTGYTIEEKVQIALKHLLPKQLEEHGLKKGDLKFSKSIIEFLIEGYTRESGVRNLEKKIAKMVRYAAKNIAAENDYTLNLTQATIKEVLGAPKALRSKYENNDVAGVVTGLAWTSVGGDILFIESILSRGKGQLNITGNLGKVMKESATLALEYIKANADKLNINPDIFEKYNVHIHVPEGATPKDGPSAGITLLTSLVSLFTQRKVKQSIAMTGEITLRGKVLPVGGIKEKILAAKRANIKEIILCEENRSDVEEVKPAYLKGLKFHFVNTMQEVIDIALLKQKVSDAKDLEKVLN